MGNENSISPISFFDDPEAESLFGRLDYQLKDGVHIQGHTSQYDLFNFLVQNEQSLNLFYSKYYGVHLRHAGIDVNRYFFIDFTPGDRGEIDALHRNFLKPEYVIIGFLVYKICFIDGNIDLNSVKKLQLAIRNDYEELKQDIYRILSKLRKSSSTTLADSKVDELIVDALKEFRKLGWIVLEDDFFDILPAFQRLTLIYGDYINNIEEWIKKATI